MALPELPKLMTRGSIPSPAPNHPAKPLKCLAFRGLCFWGRKGVEEVSRRIQRYMLRSRKPSLDWPHQAVADQLLLNALLLS